MTNMTNNTDQHNNNNYCIQD